MNIVTKLSIALSMGGVVGCAATPATESRGLLPRLQISSKPVEMTASEFSSKFMASRHVASLPVHTWVKLKGKIVDIRPVGPNTEISLGSDGKDLSVPVTFDYHSEFKSLVAGLSVGDRVSLMGDIMPEHDYEEAPTLLGISVERLVKK